MKVQLAAGAAALAVIALIVLTTMTLTHHSRDPSDSSGGLAGSGASGVSAPEDQEPLTPTSRFNVSERTEEGVNVIPQMAELVDQLHTPESEPSDDLSQVGEIIRFYHTTFGSIPPGGENADIVRALTGANPKRIAAIPPGHKTLNSQGEWLDRWGTPYHFHPISRNILEIRSAGPDRTLYTEDDLVSGGDDSIVVDRPPSLPVVAEES